MGDMQAPRQAPAEQIRSGAWGHARLALLPLPSATALLGLPTSLAPSFFIHRTEGPWNAPSPKRCPTGTCDPLMPCQARWGVVCRPGADRG